MIRLGEEVLQSTVAHFNLLYFIYLFDIVSWTQSFVFCCDSFFFLAGDQTKGLTYAKYPLYHWATLLDPMFLNCM